MQQMIGASALTLASPVSMPTSVGAEHVAQREELLRHQRLDRCGVEGAPARRPARRSGRRSRPGSCRTRSGVVEDDVGPGDDLDQRLLLVRVQGEPLLLGPAGEGVEDRVGIGRLLGMASPAVAGRPAERMGLSMRRPSGALRPRRQLWSARCDGRARRVSGVAVEQAGHRAVGEHLVDGARDQRRDREHGQLVEPLVVGDRRVLVTITSLMREFFSPSTAGRTARRGWR